MFTLKIGHVVPFSVIKALPDYDAYLVIIAGSQVLAVLPKKYAFMPYRVGDAAFAAVFMIQQPRVVLTQKNHQFFKKILEGIISPLLVEGRIKIKRVAVVSEARFVKAVVQSICDEDPVALCLPLLKEMKNYTNYTVTLIRHADKPETMVANALAPAPADKILRVIHWNDNADVYVAGEYIGYFLGKHGSNVACASKLLGIPIKVIPIT